MAHPTRICRLCRQELPTTAFMVNRTGSREYLKTACKTCENISRTDRARRASPRVRTLAQNEERASRERERRRDPVRRPYYIVQDARREDAKRGRENDLDEDFVDILLKTGCTYCTSAATTLDRVENGLGHLKANVVPACARCNYMRRDMPYAAWLLIVPALKEAISLGLLDGWIAGGWPVRR